MATINIKVDPKSLQCSICLETVSDPRILPCGHTFCGLKSQGKCLQQLDPGNTGTIRCPNCKTKHRVRVAAVPPDIKCREMLDSLDFNKQGNPICQKHDEEIVMRCLTDEKEICLSCIAGDHSGHKMEKVHKREQKRLSDYWNKENAKFEDKQLKCRRRKDLVRNEADYLADELLQEEYLDNQLRILITRRDVITKKLASDDFHPDDEDIMALKEFMDQLKATSECQQEASEDVRQRSQQLIDLVDSRTPTYCKNININSMSPRTRPKLISKVISGLSKRPIAQIRTTSEGGNRSRQDLCKGKLPEENLRCTNMILALGNEGKQYILGLKDSRWEQWKGMRCDFKWGFGAVCHEKKVYIIGGLRSSTEASRKVDMFCICECKWNEGPDLNIPRVDAAACFIQSQRSIYICGGSESACVTDALGSVETLELDENGNTVGKWKEVAPMKEKRDRCAAVAVGIRLFVTGGNDQNKKNLSSVEIFDTEIKEWSYGPEMKQCRYNHSVEYYDGSIYAMGGCIGFVSEKIFIESCEKFDLLSWTWTSIESLLVPRAMFGSVVANGIIHVVGGCTKGNDDEDWRSMELYDPVTKTWSIGPQLPEPTGPTKCVCW